MKYVCWHGTPHDFDTFGMVKPCGGGLLLVEKAVPYES